MKQFAFEKEQIKNESLVLFVRNLNMIDYNNRVILGISVILEGCKSQ